jgi:hypothetical protein
MAANALLQGIIDDVLSLVKRPDLVGNITVAVKAATLKVHHSDFYYKDLFETGISFTTAAYQQTLAYQNLIPRWRAGKYLRKVLVDSSSSVGYSGGDFIKILLPEQVLDSYNRTKTDVAYYAGDVLQIRSSTQESQYLVGCYLHPIVIPETYESWIARECPMAIVYDAAATVFKGIGFDEQAAAYRSDAGVWFQELKINYITPVGM